MVVQQHVRWLPYYLLSGVVYLLVFQNLPMSFVGVALGYLAFDFVRGDSPSKVQIVQFVVAAVLVLGVVFVGHHQGVFVSFVLVFLSVGFFSISKKPVGSWSGSVALYWLFLGAGAFFGFLEFEQSARAMVFVPPRGSSRFLHSIGPVGLFTIAVAGTAVGNDVSSSESVIIGTVAKVTSDLVDHIENGTIDVTPIENDPHR